MSKRTIILILCGALLIAAAFVSLIIELKPKTEEVPNEEAEEGNKAMEEENVATDVEYGETYKATKPDKPLKVVKDNNFKVTPANESGNEKET